LLVCPVTEMLLEQLGHVDRGRAVVALRSTFFPSREVESGCDVEKFPLEVEAAEFEGSDFTDAEPADCGNKEHDFERVWSCVDHPRGRIRVEEERRAFWFLRDVVVNGWNGFQSLDWSADGKGLYASSQSPQAATLLYSDLEGHAQVLWRRDGIFKTWGIPSPDGRHLAFVEWTSANNVWMIENF